MDCRVWHALACLADLHTNIARDAFGSWVSGRHTAHRPPGDRRDCALRRHVSETASVTTLRGPKSGEGVQREPIVAYLGV